MRPKALLGIVGVKTSDNITEIFGASPAPEPASHRLMVGVALSDKDDRAVTPIFPRREDILSLLMVGARRFGKNFHANLNLAMQIGGPRCKGLIVETPIWPDERHLERFRADQENGVTVALVVGQDMLEDSDYAVGNVVKRLSRYQGLVDYAFIEPRFRRLGYDMEWLDDCVKQVYSRLNWLGVAIAEVPGPDTVHLLEPLLMKCPEVGLVASRMVRSGDGVDAHKTFRFIERACGIYRSSAEARAA